MHLVVIGAFSAQAVGAVPATHAYTPPPDVVKSHILFEAVQSSRTPGSFFSSQTLDEQTETV